MTASRSTRANRSPALRAAPRTIGSARARDPLAHEVRLLGALLGQVIIEQEGMDRFQLVERVRRSAIARRRGDGRDDNGQDELFGTLAPTDAECLARAFTIYFLLTNLAEERHRVRTLARRARSRTSGPIDESLAAAVREVSHDQLATVLNRMELAPVLTAHPTETRRRTGLIALDRIRGLLDRFDDPRLTPAEDRRLRRRLLEEITLLWRTGLLRARPPTPLDEVRAAMAFFDETLFRVTPQLYRRLQDALGDRPDLPPARAFLRWGSWVGSDRDGHPGVDARVTLAAARIQADHLLGGYAQVAERLLGSLALRSSAGRQDPLAAQIAAGSQASPERAAWLQRRFPDQPYRVALGLIGERLARTRARLSGSAGEHTGAYRQAAELRADLAALQEALRTDGATRIADGELQDFVWQVETFGFHLASLEVRQHASIHAAALRRLRGGDDPGSPLAPGAPSAAEVLDTFRVIERIQSELGPAACHRYVISFCRRPADVTAVLRLAEAAGLRAGQPFDVVPLLESSDALSGAAPLLARLLSSRRYRRHLDRRGGRQEVMLGYSDSNKELGYLGAAWALHQAQEQLVAVARESGVELTLFHGRGGPIGRGGGPAARAIVAQAAGSVDGRLKLTEQGEVIAARYADERIALRHLEQLTHALILASGVLSAPHGAPTSAGWRPMMDELAADARQTYRRLVWDDPDFAAFFQAATPIAEIAAMQIGSRPARRQGSAEQPRVSLEHLRAIPWVFSWSQSRIDLPAWYGAGTALAAYRLRHRRTAGRTLAAAYRDWPFFRATFDNLELSLAVADRTVARRYLSLAGEAPAMRRIAARIEDEYDRTVAELLRVTGRPRLLDGAERLRRSIELRNPYLDPLAELQVQLLARLRAAPGSRDASEVKRLIQVTVSGIAAGLQHTG